ncbi:MAG: hypothetical protein IH624_05720 [Phycisphaerae bacterium]|nr:hypothetical protein [Phycisphaerae bacterium]
MITFIREIIAAPVRVAAWANGFLRLFDPIRLAEWTWLLTGDPADGAGVVVLTARGKGVDAARQRCEAIFLRRPDERIAAAMAWVEVSQGNNPKGAAEWIRRSRAAGCQDGAALLQLELSLSEHTEGDDFPALVDRILSRNDLPGHLTRDALLGKARVLFAERRWEEARAIAERILVIEEHAVARWVRWVTAQAAGDGGQAQVDYAQMTAGMPPAVLWGFEALGWLYLGDAGRVEAVLNRRTDDGKPPLIMDRRLADYVRSRHGEVYGREDMN